MKKYYHFLIFSLGLIILLSCEKDVDLSTNNPSKLCLNCILNPDSVITARLTKSRDIKNSSEFETINDARITLIENGIELGELTPFGNGNYQMNYNPKIRTKYEIDVSYQNYPKITATTVIPAFPIVQLNENTKKNVELEEDIIEEINFEIKDSIGVNSYWYYVVRSRFEYIVHGVNYECNAPFIDDFNREIDNDSRYGFVYYYYLRILDTGFDGKELRFNQNKETSMTYYFLSPDDHYDKYMKSSLKVMLNNEKDLPFHEPVQIYSNIKNGNGIFGSCAITSIKL
jgi:hypothetical protein